MCWPTPAAHSQPWVPNNQCSDTADTGTMVLELADCANDGFGQMAENDVWSVQITSVTNVHLLCKKKVKIKIVVWKGHYELNP